MRLKVFRIYLQGFLIVRNCLVKLSGVFEDVAHIVMDVRACGESLRALLKHSKAGS